MSDEFTGHQKTLSDPATRLVAVTPGPNELPVIGRAIVVRESGNVSIRTTGGDSGIVYVAAGVPFPIRCTHIYATDTTATGIAILS